MGGSPPDGLDQSFDTTPPAQCKKLGVRVVSMYLSWTPSKNITPAKVKAYHHVDVASLVNWESQAGAPLLGAEQGRKDATEAVRQLKALISDVGYTPGNRLIIYFSCDRDVTTAQFPKIDAYYRAAGEVCHADGFGVGAYGEADLIAHLANAGITDAEWQTYAWSGGKLAPAADFYQYDNGQKVGGAAVDFDRVIHDDQLGAWWAPGNPLNQGDDDMATPHDIWSWPLTLGKTKHRADTWLTLARQDANAAHAVAKDAQEGVAALAQKVTDLETAVTGLSAGGGKVDVDALAEAVVTKLADRLDK